MSYLKNTFREVSNPHDFKQEYLSSPEHSFCEACNDLAPKRTSNFLEIATLEQLKQLHKHDTFGGTRRKFYTMVLLTAGSVQETIGYHTHTFEAGTLYFIPENQLHAIHHWSKDVKGYHCIFDADYFLLCLKNQVKLHQYPFFQHDKSPFIRLTTTETDMVAGLFNKLRQEYCNRQTFNDDLLVRLYLNVLLIETERIFLSQNNDNDPHLPRKEQLVASFKNLVSKHYMDYKQVSDYAKLLFVNPHYLNDTVKEITGNPASSFIYRQLVTEAKAQLIQSSATIADIAIQLNFADQSYFGRFFKKHTGVTPLQYRHGHRHHGS
ncbi:AraC family transcriptional regulator [Chitinophaga qingshengii]|uniref:AraC family transcriptional regulator n=1 Tax=Chitinophaga qingshengii TaxID=1569794 RepID=A0ABR7TUL2_9BACT|nr:AraC family transcriptional regulator [Chitinophaga qingshengii]MBC9934177.1 AraC family transcriptional regulator [Chitinophaga qingshengii]